MNAGLFRIELKSVVRACPLGKPGDAPQFHAPTPRYGLSAVWFGRRVWGWLAVCGSGECT